MGKQKEIGNVFEELCKNYLVSLGYNILDTNYYSRYGEIDIIATDGEYLAFVEVKARKRKSIVKACESVNYSKKVKIIKTAYKYLVDNDFRFCDLKLQPRFDVCEVYFEQHGLHKNNSDKNKFDVCNSDQNIWRHDVSNGSLEVNYIKNAFDLNSVNLDYGLL